MGSVLPACTNLGALEVGARIKTYTRENEEKEESLMQVVVLCLMFAKKNKKVIMEAM